MARVTIVREVGGEIRDWEITEEKAADLVRVLFDQPKKYAPRVPLSDEDFKKALTMRALGRRTGAIARELKLSNRTLEAAFQKHDA